DWRSDRTHVEAAIVQHLRDRHRPFVGAELNGDDLRGPCRDRHTRVAEASTKGRRQGRQSFATLWLVRDDLEGRPYGSCDGRWGGGRENKGSRPLDEVLNGPGSSGHERAADAQRLSG